MATSHPAPPDTLDGPLEVDPADWRGGHIYYLMTGLVIPRPIAWVSTLSSAGVANLAPHSFFNVVGHTPPAIVFSSTGRKDTLTNIEATGEFVLNIATTKLVEELNYTSTDFPPEESEFEWAGLEETPSSVVAPPRVAAAPAHLECRHVQTVPIGKNFVILGEVVHIHVDPSIWRGGRVDPRLLDPICRLAGKKYAELGEIFELPRPKWEDVQHTKPTEAIPRKTGEGSST